MAQSESLKSEQGKVSILMGIYNCAPTLKEAIDSILNQTYTNWELILCDDCSTDDSYKIALTFSKKDKRVKVFKNEISDRILRARLLTRDIRTYIKTDS